MKKTFIIVLAVFLIACKKEDVNLERTHFGNLKAVQMPDFNIENENYNNFVRAFNSLYHTNPDVKTYIINKAIEGIYGHNSLIYAMSYTDEIAGTPLHELLYNSLDDSLIEPNYFTNTLIDEEPYLAITLHNYYFDTLAASENELLNFDFSVAYSHEINDSSMEIQISQDDTTVFYSEIAYDDEFFDHTMFVVHEFSGLVFLDENYNVVHTSESIEGYLKSQGVLDPNVDYDCDEIITALTSLIQNHFLMQAVVTGNSWVAILFHELVAYYKENCLPPPTPPAWQEECLSPWDCDRDGLFGREQIVAIKFNSKSAYDFAAIYKSGWFNRQFYFSFLPHYTYNGTPMNSPTQHIFINRKDMKDLKKYYIQNEKPTFHNWCFQENGEKFIILLISNRKNTSTNATTYSYNFDNGDGNGQVSVTTTVTLSHRSMGGVLAYYCDPSPIGGRAYSTGNMTIWLRSLP